MPIGATLAGAGIAAGGSLIAAGMQKDASNKATAATREMYETTRQDLRPFADTGKSALYTLADFYGLDRNGGGSTGRMLNPESLEAFTRSPDYQFAMKQGIRAVNQGRAARGGLDSGKTNRSIATFASDLASSNIGNYLNRLYQLAGIGSNAAAGNANAAMGTGRTLADLALAGGEASASGVVGGVNAINNGIGSTVNTLMQLRGMNDNSRMSSFNPRTASQGFIY